MSRSDRIHPPTPRRRKLAKQQGRGPRSGEVLSAGTLLALIAALHGIGSSIASQAARMLAGSLSTPLLSMTPADGFRLIAQAVGSLAILCLPLVLSIAAAAVALNWIQRGWVMTPDRLLPSANRLSPKQRMASWFSLRNFSAAVINLFKLAAVIAVIVAIARESLPALMGITQLPIELLAAAMFDSIVQCCTFVALTLMAFALADYAVAWWQFEKSLMMTEQELREEMRDAQGAKLAVRHARSGALQAVDA